MVDLVFLRPQWLVLLPAVPVLAVWLWARSGRTSAWRTHGDPELLAKTLEPLRGRGWLGWSLLVLAGGVTVLALAGPSWESSLTGAMRPAHTRVIVLDLSRSMDARDVQPSRLGLALGKVRAILERSRGLQVGLTVFAGASFHVAPLTTDAATLTHHLPFLETSLMPVQGSRPDMGLAAAGELLGRGGALTGEVILVSDGYRGDRARAEAAHLLARGFPVSVLGVGTAQGATIPVRAVGDGEVLHGLAGKVVIAPAYLDGLRAIAKAGGGRYATAGPGDADLDAVLLSSERWRRAVRDPDRRLSVPKDGGPWLVLALLPLAALAFRRGWLLVLPLALSLPVTPARAAWQDWLEGADYRAALALRAGDPEAALRLARDPLILGAALYRLGQYAAAAEAFAQSPAAVAYYNRGNALAHLGKLREAVAAYERALALDPGLADARFNRVVLARLLEPESASAGDESGGAAPGTGRPQRGQTGTGSGSGHVGRPPERDRTSAASSPSPPAATSPSPSSPALAGPAPVSAGQEEPEQPPREFASVGPEGVSRARAARWLARVPDEPGGLLREKFALEYEKRRWTRTQNTDSW